MLSFVAVVICLLIITFAARIVFAEGESGKYCTKCGKRFEAMRNPDDVAFAQSVGDFYKLNDYCRQFPLGKHVEQAKVIINEIQQREK